MKTEFKFKTRQEILQDSLRQKQDSRRYLQTLSFEEKYRRIVEIQKRHATIKTSSSNNHKVIVWPD